MATFLLFSSIVIHPAIGFFHFVITLVFSLPLLGKEGYLKRSLEFIFGVSIPLAVVSIIFGHGSQLSAEDFIYHYVKIRHPKHYLMSYVLGIQSVIWVILLILPVVASLFIKNLKIIALSSSVFSSLLLALSYNILRQKFGV